MKKCRFALEEAIGSALRANTPFVVVYVKAYCPTPGVAKACAVASSIWHPDAIVGAAVSQAAPPRFARAAGNTENFVLYPTSDVPMVRIAAPAFASTAVVRAWSKRGMAMAAIIKMMATTMSNSNQREAALTLGRTFTS